MRYRIVWQQQPAIIVAAYDATRIGAYHIAAILARSCRRRRSYRGRQTSKTAAKSMARASVTLAASFNALAARALRSGAQRRRAIMYRFAAIMARANTAYSRQPCVPRGWNTRWQARRRAQTHCATHRRCVKRARRRKRQAARHQRRRIENNQHRRHRKIEIISRRQHGSGVAKSSAASKTWQWRRSEEALKNSK